MRLAALFTAAMLLIVVVPAYAHDADGPHGLCNDSDDHRGHETLEYTCEIVVEDDARVEPGWWDNHGIGLDTSDTNEPASQDNQVRWLHLDDVESDSDYRVTVRAMDGAVAGLDVFTYEKKQGGSEMTPTCPQNVLDPILPDGRIVGAIFHLQHVATQQHQRGVDSLTVDLDPEDAPDGYLVAIYPMAAESVSSPDAKPTINYTVQATDQGDEVTVWDNFILKSTAPFKTSEWFPPLSHTEVCVDRLQGRVLDLVDIPFPPEVPSGAPDAPSASDLFDTHLEPRSE